MRTSQGPPESKDDVELRAEMKVMEMEMMEMVELRAEMKVMEMMEMVELRAEMKVNTSKTRLSG